MSIEEQLLLAVTELSIIEAQGFQHLLIQITHRENMGHVLRSILTELLFWNRLLTNIKGNTDRETHSNLDIAETHPHHGIIN